MTSTYEPDGSAKSEPLDSDPGKGQLDRQPGVLTAVEKDLSASDAAELLKGMAKPANANR